ncbi:copper chaperone PCu(A)C [Streptomyces sodiiphilus]|uniref:Copper chaperone PCu(A)C n=1 Tax=Streptomyces sodiiphilus TaxID=226217 RepID=A0ABN2PTL1_9ACTN
MTHRTIRRASALLAALALGLTGCSGSGGPELTTEGAFMPEPVDERRAGGFLTVVNSGDEDDTLLSADSDIAGKVELHETVDNAMRQVESFPVPAGGELELKRGGNHLMFFDLDPKPTEGDTVTIELEFEKSGRITLEVPVKAAIHTGHQGG